MSRIPLMISLLGLTACTLDSASRTDLDLPDELETRLVVAGEALSKLHAAMTPMRGTREQQRDSWAAVDDLVFLDAGNGSIQQGGLRFTWSLYLRNQGLDAATVESDLEAAAGVMGQLDLDACEPTEIEIYEVEAAYANEPGRFNLAQEPARDQQLVGVYDPRSLEPGVAAIMLTNLGSNAAQRALVAHELAHHVHHACGLGGDSEDFAEEIEAAFQKEPRPQRVATRAPLSTQNVQNTPAAPIARRPDRPVATRPSPAAARSRAMMRARGRRAPGRQGPKGQRW